MTLETSYKTTSGIPQEYQHLYTKTGAGEYTLCKGSDVKTIDDFNSQRKLDAALRAEVKQHNMFDAAIDDALAHANRELQVQNDKIVDRDDLSVSDWLVGKRATAPHWFDNQSAETNTKESQGKKLRQNPWSAKHWNITEQGQMMRQNREVTEQLAEAVETR